jgi:hypothetical protein
MSNRTAKFVSAILASVLAGAFLATLSPGPARAADDCLAAPKGASAEGSHWYYRIDRATKRHCWYLREEGEKSSQAAAPKAAAATQRSIADAHAEMPAPTRVEPPAGNDGSSPAVPAQAAGTENSPGASADDTAAQSSVVASRWPGQGDNSAVSAPPAASHAGTIMRTTATTTAAPAIAAVTPPAADSSAATQTGSMAMLLSVMAGALALAGIVAGAVFKLGSTRGPRQGMVHARSGIWEPTDDERIVLQARLADEMPRRTGFARDLDQADDPGERITEFFSQLSRRAPT